MPSSLITGNATTTPHGRANPYHYSSYDERVSDSSHFSRESGRMKRYPGRDGGPCGQSFARCTESARTWREGSEGRGGRTFENRSQTLKAKRTRKRDPCAISQNFSRGREKRGVRIGTKTYLAKNSNIVRCSSSDELETINFDRSVYSRAQLAERSL